MEAEKKAKMVEHTNWIAPSNQPYTPTLPPFNQPFQPVPAFSYNPYPANWQPPLQNSQGALSQPPNLNPQENLPPPPPGPPPKEENSNPHQSQPSPLPTFGMIMPISGCSSLEFENKRQRKNYFRQVHSIMPEGIFKRT